MYCPNCGKTNSAEQKFCRSCGLRLEQIVQSLVEQTKNPDQNLITQQRNLDRWINIVAGVTVSILVGAVIWGIVYAIIIVKGAVVSGSIFLAVILGIVLFALLNLYRHSLASKSSKGSPQPSLTESTAAADTGKLLSEPRYEPVPSVVENTTELLTVEKQNRCSSK